MKNLPAIILAAGKGQRLGKMTEDNPKPMVQIDNTTIIDNLVSLLIKNGIEQIIVVTGYMHDKLSSHLATYSNLADIVIIENVDFATTNNIYSLWLANKYFSNGFYLFEADVFFEEKLIIELLNSPHKNLIVIGKFTKEMNGTVVDLDSESQVKNMYLKRHQQNDFDFSNKYKTVNFYKLGADFQKDFFYKKLKKHIIDNDLNSYYELIIHEAIIKGFNFHGLKTGILKWWEIDTQEDLEYCEELFR